MSSHHHHHEERNGFVAPLIVGFLIFIALIPAYLAACCEKPFRTVRLFVLPVSFAISQLVGGMSFLMVGWIIALIIGSKGMANYVVGHLPDLTMLSVLFDSRDLPWWHIIIFQVILWFVMVQPLTRHLTMSVYDFAIQKIGDLDNVHPYYIREEIIEKDDDYLEAFEFYKSTGKPPLLGLILVAFSRTPVREYY